MTSSTSFYVILPSNTNVDGNRTNAFRVRLPRKLEFSAEWCVGLAVLVYPHTWPALGTSSEQFVEVHWRTGKSFRIALPSSTFQNPLELRDGLKKALGGGDELLASSMRTVQNTLSHLQEKAKELAAAELSAKQRESTAKEQAAAAVTAAAATIAATSSVGSPFRPSIPSISDKGNDAKHMKEEATQLLLQQQQQKLLPDDKQSIDETASDYKALYSHHLNLLISKEDEETRAALEETRELGLEAWIHAYRKVRNCCRFDFDVERQRFRVEIKEQFIERLVLSDQLAYILGLNSAVLMADSARLTEARFQPDMRGGISSFYVYTPGLIEPVIVGDVTAPLLRVVNIRGHPDEIIEEQFIAIQYHKLLVKELSEVYVEIRTASGTLMPFQYGTCQLTLHFKKAPYF